MSSPDDLLYSPIGQGKLELEADDVEPQGRLTTTGAMKVAKHFAPCTNGVGMKCYWNSSRLCEKAGHCVGPPHE